MQPSSIMDCCTDLLILFLIFIPIITKYLMLMHKMSFEDGLSWT